MISVFRMIVVTVLASASSFANAQALPAGPEQAYPAKEIRLVCPYAPGAGGDFITRALAQELSVNLGKPVIVENRPGANGIVGMGFVARSAPDGYTLVLAISSGWAINPNLYSKLPYDSVKDFAPIILLAGNPQFLVVHPSLPVKSVKELIVLAKARKAQLAYASAGSGSASHLASEALKTMTGTDILHVPYKGAGLAITDLISGQVQLSLMGWITIGPHVKTGRLRVLGVTSAKRSLLLPDLPAIAETVPGYDFSLWYGVAAPTGTSGEIIGRLNTEILRVLAARDFRQRIEAQAIEPIGSTPEKFGNYIKSEITKWGRVVKDSGAKSD